MPERREYGEEVCHRPCAYRQELLLWTQEGLGKEGRGNQESLPPESAKKKKMEGERTVGEVEDPGASLCGT